MAKGDRWSDDQNVKVREMRNAETVLGVIREREFKVETTGELLEIERLTSGSEGGGWKRTQPVSRKGLRTPAQADTSPAAYPTARPVLRGGGGGDLTSLPDYRYPSMTFAALNSKHQDAARKSAKTQLEERFDTIIQRRHDCIHNRDRPKMAPQPLLKGGTVIKVIEDVEFLVVRCDEHINDEFPEFLRRCRCPDAIIRQSG
jgi:hypothetical protein